MAVEGIYQQGLYRGFLLSYKKQGEQDLIATYLTLEKGVGGSVADKSVADKSVK